VSEVEEEGPRTEQNRTEQGRGRESEEESDQEINHVTYFWIDIFDLLRTEFDLSFSNLYIMVQDR